MREICIGTKPTRFCNFIQESLRSDRILTLTIDNTKGLKLPSSYDKKNFGLTRNMILDTILPNYNDEKGEFENYIVNIFMFPRSFKKGSRLPTMHYDSDIMSMNNGTAVYKPNPIDDALRTITFPIVDITDKSTEIWDYQTAFSNHIDDWGKVFVPNKKRNNLIGNFDNHEVTNRAFQPTPGHIPMFSYLDLHCAPLVASSSDQFVFRIDIYGN